MIFNGSNVLQPNPRRNFGSVAPYGDGYPRASLLKRDFSPVVRISFEIRSLPVRASIQEKAESVRATLFDCRDEWRLLVFVLGVHVDPSETKKESDDFEVSTVSLIAFDCTKQRGLLSKIVWPVDVDFVMASEDFENLNLAKRSWNTGCRPNVIVDDSLVDVEAGFKQNLHGLGIVLQDDSVNCGPQSASRV
ncbi:hypothetical protein CPLU01_09352 [Colletotrichum plurivorum]|uniref:Uncharacterized protein n=1 Tax=Colletotrichum plurivorum TaxID=2175906 RepID=A0A8H6K920_9PEZI|nr:hypothetical protein CPLU01_09352 [Colletotrichum plurivorum]